MSDTRRAHAPIEYAVTSASGADGHVEAKACSVLLAKRTLAQRPGLLMNPTRPSAANLAVIENGHS